MQNDPKSTTILLVEDNPADALYASQLLPAANFTFIEAQSLAQALDCIGNRHLDVVLLDLHLPDSQGMITLEHLLARGKELPVVVLTGLEDVSCAIEALRAGAQNFIVKAKLNADVLVKSISDAIDSKKQQRRLLLQARVSNLAVAVSQPLLQATSLPEMLRGCTDAIVDHLDAAFARIWTVAEREPVLILQASSGLYTEIDGSHARVPIGQLKVGLIASEKKPHLTNALQEDPLLSDPEWAQREGMVAFAGHPLLVGEELVGVIAMFARHPLDDIVLEGLSQVANRIALAIERSKADETRALLASIVLSSDEAILSTTLDGTVHSWNQAAGRIFGFTADEMIDQNFSRLMVGGGGEELSRMMEMLKQGEYIGHYETTGVRKDGVVIEVSMTLSPISHSSGTVSGASAILRDITKRKQSDRLSFAQNDVTRILSESDSLAAAAPGILKLLSKAVPADFSGLWCLDRDQQVLLCVDVWHELDPTLTEMAAISRHVTFSAGTSLPGRVYASGAPGCIASLADDGFFARLPAAKRGGLHSACAFPILLGTKVLGVIEFFSRKSHLPAAELFEVMAIIGAQVGQFIDRKFAEESSKTSSRAQLRLGQAIMENAPIGIAWLDKNLIISEANEAFSHQFGFVREGLPGTYIFASPTGIPNEQLLDVIQKGTHFSATNFRIALGGTRGPRDAYCDLTIWPVKDDDDVPVGLVILTVEVTERVKLSKQREDFVATLTHDLKNPLVGQERMLSLILNEQLGVLPADLAKILNLLKSGTHDLLELIGTLLEVYRYEEGAPQLRLEAVDVKHIIMASISQLNPIAEAKGVEIKSDLPESVTAFGDKLALRRVVMNLLDNAIKFTPPGGLIHVECLATESHLSIAVEDTGVGISADELALLFQRFSQSDSGKQDAVGTGLGLYLCRQIAEAHGGAVTCTSNVGRGSKFVLTLPCGEQQNVAVGYATK